MESDELNQEIIEHLMNPKNYGKLTDHDGAGVGHDDKTGEYVVFYVKTDGETISDVRFSTNGCQDTVVLGSLFTEMIKGDTIENSKKAVEKMDRKLSTASAQQQACAEMVLSSFIAALINRENRLKGKKEELHAIAMKQSCDINKEEKNDK